MFTFLIKMVVRGYHICKEVWNAAMDGTELPCEREIGNAHDPFAVAIKKATPTGNVTVGHPPRVISLVYSVFILLRWNYSLCSEWNKTTFI